MNNFFIHHRRSRCKARWAIAFTFSLTHHDDGDHQRSQTDQVELLREQLDQFVMAALGGGEYMKHIGTLINKLDYVPRV